MPPPAAAADLPFRPHAPRCPSSGPLPCPCLLHHCPAPWGRRCSAPYVRHYPAPWASSHHPSPPRQALAQTSQGPACLPRVFLPRAFLPQTSLPAPPVRPRPSCPWVPWACAPWVPWRSSPRSGAHQSPPTARPPPPPCPSPAGVAGPCPCPCPPAWGCEPAGHGPQRPVRCCCCCAAGRQGSRCQSTPTRAPRSDERHSPHLLRHSQTKWTPSVDASPGQPTCIGLGA